MLIVLGIIVVIGIVSYFDRGGSLFGNTGVQESSESSETSTQQKTNQKVSTGQVTQPQPDTLAQPVNPNITLRNVPKGFTIEQLSPDFGYIRIVSVAPPRQSYGRISLRTFFSMDRGPINISGWVLRSNKNDAETIPQGVGLHSPFGTVTEEDIVLRGGETINIYSTKSPTGTNLRLNKCMGFLNDILEFTPPLPRLCPSVDLSQISTFSGKCQNYIRSLRACEVPDPNQFGFIEETECREFLSGINYRGCVELLQSDANFLRQEWRIWADRDFLYMDTLHDRILLFDRNGLLVSEYVY